MSQWDVETKEYKEYQAREIPPSGVIPARICAFIDVGTHEIREFSGSGFSSRPSLWLGYELIEKDSQGKPFYLSEIVRLSMGTSATLYEYVTTLHGKIKEGEKLNTDWIANQPCLLQISHTTKEKKGKTRVYPNIDGLMAIPKGTITPQGNCVIWRVRDRLTIPLPDVSHLPPLWHESSGKMLSVKEWVELSEEVTGEKMAASNFRAADSRMPSTGTPAIKTESKDVIPTSRIQPFTQAEVDSITKNVPF